MKEQCQLRDDIMEMYGQEAHRHFAMGKLLQSEEAQVAWAKITKRKDINRKHILALMPEIMLQAAVNAGIPAEVREHKQQRDEEIAAIDLLMKKRGFLTLAVKCESQVVTIAAREVLQKVRDNIDLTDQIATDYFSRFPNSQKRRDERLTFTMMLSSQMKRTFGHPLVDLCTEMGLALYPAVKEIDRDTLRRALTREKARTKPH